MSWQAKFISLFPLIHIALVLWSIYFAISGNHFSGIMLTLTMIYLFPVFCYRMHNSFCPLKTGKHAFQHKVYQPWWGAYQIQALFIAVPWIEALLRLVPEAYTFWLRMWGSQIGKKVIFAPKMEILDRGFLEIGDNTLLGYECRLMPHFIKKNTKGSLELYLERIKIGSNVTLGAGCRLGPGVEIGDGARLRILTDIQPDGVIPRNGKTKGREVILGRSGYNPHA